MLIIKADPGAVLLFVWGLVIDAETVSRYMSKTLFTRGPDQLITEVNHHDQIVDLPQRVRLTFTC